jgi:hypothetical protein
MPQPLQHGEAARSGVEAAQLTQHGFTADPQILDMLTTSAGTRVRPLGLHGLPQWRSWYSASRHKIRITYGIKPEERRKHLSKEKLPNQHSSYAANEKHYTLRELSIIKLSQATDE